MKKCTKCQAEKLNQDFFKDKTRKDGFYPTCKDCKNQYHFSHKQNKKNYDLIRSYGISLETRNAMLKEQNNKCFICSLSLEDHLSKYNKMFSVDHNHETGQIRKLLCIDCNLLIGQAKDNIDTLKKAINYLELHALITRPKNL